MNLDIYLTKRVARVEPSGEDIKLIIVGRHGVVLRVSTDLVMPRATGDLGGKGGQGTAGKEGKAR